MTDDARVLAEYEADLAHEIEVHALLCALRHPSRNPGVSTDVDALLRFWLTHPSERLPDT